MTPRRVVGAFVLLLTFALVASWFLAPARAGAGSTVQSKARMVTPRHLTGTNHGAVYPLKLPPAAPTLTSRPRLLRRTERQLSAMQARQIELPALPSLASLALTTTPTVTTNFVGLAFPDSQCGPGCEPPDGQVAAGPNNIVQVSNIVMRIFDKTGTIISTTNLNTLFGVDTSIFSSDARIAYDTISGHWFISFLILDTDDITTAQNGFFYLAVSQSSDPTAGFNTFSVETTGDFADQPALGFNYDKVAQGGNSFSCNPDCEDGPYEGNEILVWNKSELLEDAANPSVDFYVPPADESDFPILPVKSRTSTTSLWLVSGCVNTESECNNAINLWQITGVPGEMGGSTGSPSLLTISRINAPPNAPQQGDSSNPIDTGDGRLLDAVYRDGLIWTSGGASCTPTGDSNARSCLKYVEVSTNTTNPSVLQDFTFGTSKFYDYYPSVDIDNFDDLLTSFTQSSSSEFPSAYVDGRLATDAADTLGTPVLIEAGAASYNSPNPETDNGNAFPWGDYSGAGIDPSDQTAIWVAAEYSGPTSEPTPNWQTWIAEARLQSPGATPIPTPTATATATATPTATATLTATSTATPTASATSTSSSSSTATATVTSTGTSSATATVTATGSSSPTATASSSSSVTASATPTATGSSSVTASATPTATATPTLTSTATATDTATATLTPTATPTPVGILSLSTSDVNFGNVKVGKKKSKKVKVKNVGKSPLEVTIGTLAPPFTVSAGSGSFTLQKGKSEKVTVEFQPAAVGAAPSQMLGIASNDPTHPSEQVTVTGSGK